MQNIKELRNELVENFELLKRKEISLKQASEMANCAGKILKSLSIELKYHYQQVEPRKIDFLEYE